MPKVSVIVPIYGVEKYLREALDSIINQTLNDLEIILIDDGGKDNCPQIIDEYALKDSRIIAIHKKNGGYGQSCNIGLERATGEYIAIMEPDDFIDPHMYEDLYNIAKEYDSDIVKSPFYRNYEDVLHKKCYIEDFAKFYNIPNTSFTIFEAPHFLFYHPSIWSAVYKREFLNLHDIRFKEIKGAGWTDCPFQVQTFCLAKKINYTNKPYYYWRIPYKNPAEKLENYRIPFDRAYETRTWMKDNNYFVRELLCAYYNRELTHIDITLGIKKFNDVNDYLNRLIQIVKEMDYDIVINSKYINKKFKNMYLRILKSPKNEYRRSRLIVLFKELLRLKKSLLKLRISRKGIYLGLFNKTIIDVPLRINQA